MSLKCRFFQSCTRTEWRRGYYPHSGLVCCRSSRRVICCRVEMWRSGAWRVEWQDAMRASRSCTTGYRQFFARFLPEIMHAVTPTSWQSAGVVSGRRQSSCNPSAHLSSVLVQYSLNARRQLGHTRWMRQFGVAVISAPGASTRLLYVEVG